MQGSSSERGLFRAIDIATECSSLACACPASCPATARSITPLDSLVARVGGGWRSDRLRHEDHGVPEAPAVDLVGARQAELRYCPETHVSPNATTWFLFSSQ